MIVTYILLIFAALFTPTTFGSENNSTYSLTIEPSQLTKLHSINLETNYPKSLALLQAHTLFNKDYIYREFSNETNTLVMNPQIRTGFIWHLKSSKKATVDNELLFELWKQQIRKESQLKKTAVPASLCEQDLHTITCDACNNDAFTITIHTENIFLDKEIIFKAWSDEFIKSNAQVKTYYELFEPWYKKSDNKKLYHHVSINYLARAIELIACAVFKGERDNLIVDDLNLVLKKIHIQEIHTALEPLLSKENTLKADALERQAKLALSTIENFLTQPESCTAKAKNNSRHSFLTRAKGVGILLFIVLYPFLALAIPTFTLILLLKYCT